MQIYLVFGITEITQFVFCSLHMHILFLSGQCKCYTKLIYLFLFYFLINVSSAKTLSLWFTNEERRTDRKRKKIGFALFLYLSKFWFNAKCDLSGLSAPLLAQS